MGLPFTIVLMVACYALVKRLMNEPRANDPRYCEAARAA